MFHHILLKSCSFSLPFLPVTFLALVPRVEAIFCVFPGRRVTWWPDGHSFTDTSYPLWTEHFYYGSNRAFVYMEKVLELWVQLIKNGSKRGLHLSFLFIFLLYVFFWMTTRRRCLTLNRCWFSDSETCQVIKSPLLVIHLCLFIYSVECISSIITFSVVYVSFHFIDSFWTLTWN